MTDGLDPRPDAIGASTGCRRNRHSRLVSLRSGRAHGPCPSRCCALTRVAHADSLETAGLLACADVFLDPGANHFDHWLGIDRSHGFQCIRLVAGQSDGESDAGPETGRSPQRECPPQEVYATR